MPTHDREQRQVYLTIKSNILQIGMFYKETDDTLGLLEGECWITAKSPLYWTLATNMLRKHIREIMSVDFEGDVVYIRYLCPQSNAEFVKVFDYIVELLDARKDR